MTGKPRPFSHRGYIDEDIIPLSFDTETEGLGGKLLCITAHCFEKPHFFSGELMVSDFFTLLQQYEYPFVWFAHAAQYDWRYFLAYIRANDIACEISMRNETDIYQIKLHFEDKKIVMRDSLAIYPNTLRNFADSYTPEIPKEHIDFDSGVIFDPSNESHRHYAIRDAAILRYGLPRFNAMLQRHFGVSMGHTTAGTAMKAWQASLPENVYYDASRWGDEEQFIRSAYFGGLVFLTTTKIIKKAKTFDLNSSYPDVMCRLGVPWGQRISTTNYRANTMGIFRVRVRTPRDLVVPILPRRDDRGYMRWNAGEFETTVTGAELQFAEAHGYEITEVFDGIAWEERIFPFNNFIDKCKTIRAAYPGKPEEVVAKLMQNSLYGKFGARRERLIVFQPEDGDEMETLDALPLDEDGFWWIKKEFSEDLRCIPAWAVFITAHARLHLLETVYDVGVEKCIYGDTDSLTVRAGCESQFDTGKEYGQWKLEKTWKEFRALAPKVYAGIIQGGKNDGKYKGAAKGLPKKKMTEKEWSTLLDGERVTVAYQTLPALRQAMAKGVMPAKPISRISTDIRNASNWELHGTQVRPKLAPTLKEKT